MSMYTRIRAFIPDTDETYQKHKKVLLACLDADVSLPKETADYFDSQEPYEELLNEKLEIELTKGVHYNDWETDDEYSEGFEVELKNIPKGVTKIIFCNVY